MLVKYMLHCPTSASHTALMHWLEYLDHLLQTTARLLKHVLYVGESLSCTVSNAAFYNLIGCWYDADVARYKDYVSMDDSLREERRLETHLGYNRLSVGHIARSLDALVREMYT